VLQCETIQNCPFCGQEGVYITPLLKDLILGVAGSWRYRQCPHCNLAWLSPRPTRETYHLAYQNYYTHSITTTERSFSTKTRQFKKMLACSIARHPDIRNYNRILRCVARILGFFPPLRELARSSCLWLDINKKGKLLDVGCGNGLFPAYMKEFGWTVCGIDPDSRAANFARNHFGIEVTVGNLRKGVFPENSFDAVTINHVIEHVHDPVETIKEAWRVLKKDGCLVITTLNMGSISRKFFSDTWRGFEVPRHLWLFTAETLAMCATRAGLSDYKLTTTARSAAGMFLDNFEIKKGSCLSGTYLQRVNWLARIGSFAYYICEYVLNLVVRNIGDELVFTAVKR